ncbi:MAG: type IV pilus modification protein PilV [Gammaproteobacteria bacterium]|nr:type IV pilus modification protein PilV [Gammaproteobacteria bacterium]
MRVKGSAGKQRGYSLMEVLVAMIILAVGLLGIAGLQALSVKNTHSAYLRSQATLLAYEIIDDIRANPSAMANYAIAIGAALPSLSTACIGVSASCTTAQLAAYDISQWSSGITGLLPGGDASVVVSGDDVTVTVQWVDKEATAHDATRIVDLEIITRIQ